MQFHDEPMHFMIIATVQMQINAHHQRKRKSKSNACLYIFGLQFHENDITLYTKLSKLFAQA